MSAGMAEILTEHVYWGFVDGVGRAACACGEWFDNDAEHVAHLAETLDTAGYGSPAETVADLESVIEQKGEKVTELLNRIANVATHLPLGCDDVFTRAGMLRVLKTDTESALKLLYEADGLRHGVNRIAL